ncbi:uncharacterized protein LOC132621078 [Lycium barbarum]|uniref:uncharacterized protein LOC132621078 n=1 Tax=Lycium barbarum TaxID=112863 RepID=UPI00293E6E2B|nr:uncharacterized protein LOC132621078 [Lycium barbarum]XP_060191202.1 uncharacterized protein LOC132621078 [Lycium barbarum]XP_060191203.1 uncharacterized protein LOC132621078 [Lycium barbarum]
MLQSLHKCQRNLCTKIRKTSFLVQFVSTSCGSNTPTDESKSLMNLCHMRSRGLSKEAIISEAKVIQLETDTCSKVSAVIEFFQNHGFSATQVKKIIGLRPRFLASRVNKTIKPKLNFLQSVGFSEDECSKIISAKPCILDRSIRNHLAPSFDFLKTFMGSKMRALVAIKHYPQILDCKVSHCWKQTVQILGQIGIPDSQVSEFIQKSPVILTTNPQKMSEVGLRLKEMGFDVTSPAFRTAIASMSRVAHPKMERKFETYRSLGFSDDEILNIFRSQPNCMFYTEENIRAIVAFYVDRHHFSLSLLSKRPNFLLCSLKRRLIPRCSVMQVLWSRGTVSEFGKLYPKLMMSEKDFLEKYVTKYETEVPELQAAYSGELMFEEYSFHLREIRQMSMSKGSSSKTKAA